MSCPGSTRWESVLGPGIHLRTELELSLHDNEKAGSLRPLQGSKMIADLYTLHTQLPPKSGQAGHGHSKHRQHAAAVRHGDRGAVAKVELDLVGFIATGLTDVQMHGPLEFESVLERQRVRDHPVAPCPGRGIEYAQVVPI